MTSPPSFDADEPERFTSWLRTGPNPVVVHQMVEEALNYLLVQGRQRLILLLAASALGALDLGNDTWRVPVSGKELLRISRELVETSIRIFSAYGDLPGGRK